MAPLSLGSQGRAVAYLQLRLGVPPGGTFDERTQDALKAVQTARGLVADGVYGPITNEALTGRSSSAIEACASAKGVEPAALGAVVQVETSGSGFLDDGRPVILLERLYVYRHATPAQRARLPVGVCAPQPGGYVGGAGEWDRYETVSAVLGEDVTTQCVSWGLGQVMGANWAWAGAASVDDFRRNMVMSEDHQLSLMTDFISSNPRMLNALRTKDWATFAAAYNGLDYAANAYDTRLAAAYAALAAAPPATPAE